MSACDVCGEECDALYPFQLVREGKGWEWVLLCPECEESERAP